MNLVIDIGNTTTKLSVFDEDEEIYSIHTSNLVTGDLQKLLKIYPVSGSILSTVQKPDDVITGYLKTHTDHFIEFSHQTPLPVKNLYKTPATLGKDRIAAAVGAHNIFPCQNVLIVDAGTALTIDMVNTEAEYLGGNISPGVNMRFKALHTFTANLPLHTPTDQYNGLGNNTQEAIKQGVMLGVLFEIEGYISRYNQQYNNLQVILTGGDASFFDNKLKKTIFVVRNLVAVGLNRIITYNATDH